MSPQLQDRFDALLQDAIDSLPARFKAALDEVPVVVVDRPDPELLAELRRDGLVDDPGESGGQAAPASGESADDADDHGGLLGLHSGAAMTHRSIESSGELPSVIHIFREATVHFAGGWAQDHADDEIYEEIRITLLHELGHHFGLDEDDLDELGYA